MVYVMSKPWLGRARVGYPKIPEVKNKDWVTNPIDNFVLKNIENNQLNISSIESKEILIRRLYFDLIGLPPSVEEVDDFINDKSEDSYLNLVDRLLDSKSYGERMDRMVFFWIITGTLVILVAFELSFLSDGLCLVHKYGEPSSHHPG